MSDFCKNCMDGNNVEIPVDNVNPCPDGCCPVQWYRFGIYCPGCRKGGDR